MLERVRENAAARGLHVTTKRHVAEQMPYDSAAFDLVTCRVAAHHFSDIPAFVREVARVLKAGGSFLLIDGSIEDGKPSRKSGSIASRNCATPATCGFSRRAAGRNSATQQNFRHLRRACAVQTAGFELVLRNSSHAFRKSAGRAGTGRECAGRARALFKLGEEDGKIVWWWQRLTLVAKKL